jgi:hypothetical protein
MNHQDTITVGKYHVSPLIRMLETGWYACSVSIRSGSGSGTHDRVLRLTRLFNDQIAAMRYATAEGMRWLGHHNPAAQGPALAAP